MSEPCVAFSAGASGGDRGSGVSLVSDTSSFWSAVKPSGFILSMSAHLWLPARDRTSRSSHCTPLQQAANELLPQYGFVPTAPRAAYPHGAGPGVGTGSRLHSPLSCLPPLPQFWSLSDNSKFPLSIPLSHKPTSQSPASSFQLSWTASRFPRPWQDTWLPVLSGWECFVVLLKQGRSAWMLLYVGIECNQTHWKWYSCSCLQVIIYFTLREKENSENSSLRGINAYQNQEWFYQNHSWWITTFFLSSPTLNLYLIACHCFYHLLPLLLTSL